MISDSRNLRCPPGVRMDPRRPVIAHRVTVFGSTRNIRATSAEVSNRSTPSNGDLSPTLSSRICHAMGHVESGHSAPCVPVRPRVSRTSRPVVGSATRRCPARAVTVESGAGDDPDRAPGGYPRQGSHRAVRGPSPRWAAPRRMVGRGIHPRWGVVIHPASVSAGWPAPRACGTHAAPGRIRRPNVRNDVRHQDRSTINHERAGWDRPGVR